MKSVVATILATALAVSALSASGPTAVAQTTPPDSAHTLVTPNTASPARPGQVQTLPGGGAGVVTGGTSHYQTLGTPGGGSALAIPNGPQSSQVIGPNGQSGIATTPR